MIKKNWTLKAFQFFFYADPGKADDIFIISFNVIHILAERTLDGISACLIIGFCCFHIGGQLGLGVVAEIYFRPFIKKPPQRLSGLQQADSGDDIMPVVSEEG